MKAGLSLAKLLAVTPSIVPINDNLGLDRKNFGLESGSESILVFATDAEVGGDVIPIGGWQSSSRSYSQCGKRHWIQTHTQSSSLRGRTRSARFQRSEYTHYTYPSDFSAKGGSVLPSFARLKDCLISGGRDGDMTK